MRVLAAILAAAAAFAGGVALARSRSGGKWTEADAKNPFFVYRARAGDTLSEIAKAFFGDASLWKILTSKAKRPEDLQVGEEVRVPCVWVTLRRGDTLTSLAAEHLGSPTAWGRIWRANEQVAKPDQLQAGWTIAVPKPPLAPHPEVTLPTTKMAVGGELEELG